MFCVWLHFSENSSNILIDIDCMDFFMWRYSLNTIQHFCERLPSQPPGPLSETSGASFKWNVLIGILREKVPGIIELWKLLMEQIHFEGKPWCWLSAVPLTCLLLSNFKTSRKDIELLGYVVIRGKSLNHTLRSFGVKIGATTFVITKASNDRNYFVDKKGTVCTWKWPHTKLLFILNILLSHCWWKLVY